MKLILTSKAFANEIVNFKLNKTLDNLEFNKTKVLYIPAGVDENLYNTDKYLCELLEFGFLIENIVRFDYTNADRYKDLNIDIIYVTGGNTFLLLDRIRKCGFDNELKKYIENGIIYIGRSAGSHLVTKHVRHVVNFDDVGNYNGDYMGLNIWDGILICHYSKDRENIYNEEKAKKYMVEKLTDEEMLVVDDERYYKV